MVSFEKATVYFNFLNLPKFTIRSKFIFLINILQTTKPAYTKKFLPIPIFFNWERINFHLYPKNLGTLSEEQSHVARDIEG